MVDYRTPRQYLHFCGQNFEIRPPLVLHDLQSYAELTGYTVWGLFVIIIDEAIMQKFAPT